MKRFIFSILILGTVLAGFAQKKRVTGENAFNQGVEYFEEEAYPQAMQCFKVWLGSHPDDAYSWAYVAAIENEATHYYAALDASDKALAGVFTNDKDTTFKGWHQYVRSLIHLNLKDTTEAINDLTEAINYNHSDADSYHRRAMLYSKIKEHDKAIADYNAVIALTDNDASPFIGLGCVYSAKGDRVNAVETFSKAIKAEPENSLAYSYRATEYYNSQAYDAAVDDVVQALKLDRGNKHALWILQYLKGDAQTVVKKKFNAVARETGDNSWLDLLK